MPDDTPDTGEPSDPTGDTPAPGPSPDDALKAEVDKWKAAARKHEERAKTNAAAAKELDRLRAETMTEQDKAVAAARTEARAETLREFGAARVDDAIRLAAAGRVVDVDALLEGVDRTRFLGDDGQPDPAAVNDWVDRLVPAPAAPGPVFPDLGQGARPGTPALNGDPLLNTLKSKLGIR